MAERRRQRRIPVHVDAFCKGAAKSGIGQLCDLSVGGCRIASKLALTTGDEAVLTLYFDRNGSVTIRGRIVSTGPKGLGVKFEHVTVSQKFHLGEIIHALN